ncbi:isochorismate synthase [bacterium]|nr:isochorismate synthase [bacterium]
MKDVRAIYRMLIERHAPPFLFWHAPGGDVHCAAGVRAEQQCPAGVDWRQWLRDAAVGEDGVPSFFALPFEADEVGEGEWEGFSAARIWQPAQHYHFDGIREHLSGMPLQTPPTASMEDSDIAWHTAAAIHVPSWDADVYEQRVRRGLQLLHAELLQKIVLARAVAIEMDVPFNPTRLLPVLQQPHSFGICYSPDGRRFFLSATPERLARVHDGTVSTMALAGTMSHAEATEPASLLKNTKERAEHAYVSTMIRDALAEFVHELKSEDVQLLRLPHITHILTRIEGRLRDGAGMLDVISALHPTPAVAGTPRSAAAKHIRELEQFPRGLYAGCIGWTDAEGNGDAAVCIRSAIIEGRQARAFAGAGIVSASDPVAEEKETRAKLQTVLDILAS